MGRESASALFEFAYKKYISLTFISVAGRRSQPSRCAENLHNLDKYQRHCYYWPVYPAMIIAFVRFSWINHACYLHGANSAPSVSCSSGHFALWGFCDSKSNKIGISLHPQVLPFPNLLSTAWDPCASLRCYQGDPAALPHAAAAETADLVCPDAEQAAAASGASCELAATIWAEKEDSSGAAGLLFGDRSLLSHGCPPCHLMVQNSTVQDCKLLFAPFAMSEPQ